jgi:hypothetical protein
LGQAPNLALEAEGLRVSWAASPHPGVAGYWVAVRGEGEERYRPLTWAGSRTEIILEAAPGLRVAVATTDAEGHMSLFSPEAALE